MKSDYFCPLCDSELEFMNSNSFYQCLNDNCKSIFDYDFEKRVGTFNSTKDLSEKDDVKFYNVSIEEFILKVKKLKAFV